MTSGSGAVLVSPKKLEIWDVRFPDLAPGGVLAKVLLAGVCGTDLHLVDGSYDLGVPIILGHEGVGVVEALGRECRPTMLVCRCARAISSIGRPILCVTDAMPAPFSRRHPAQSIRRTTHCRRFGREQRSRR